MSLTFWKSTLWGISAAGFVSLAGCTEVTRHDVTAAREEARHEQREADQARRDAAERIAEEEHETAQTRREAFRPNYDEEARAAIREEERETAEVRREAAAEVAEKQRKADEAAAEAEKTEARFAAQRARDAYVKNAELQLVQADGQIAELKDRTAGLGGEAKEVSEEKLELSETRRDGAGSH